MVAICPNPFRDIDLNYTKKCADILNRLGINSVICPVFDDSPDVIPSDIKTCALKDVLNDINLAIVVGGDGTILNVVGDIYKLDIPVLGINLGTKGFMASIEPEDIELITGIASGEYSLSERMMLDVSLVRNNKEIYSGTVLNDVVLHGYGDTIKLDAYCDKSFMTEFSGDGIIVSTPTGSTGYSLSTGGPIVEPDTATIIVSPICAHSLGARSFVLDSSRVVEITVSKLHDRRAYLSADGNSEADLSNGDIIRVKKSEYSVSMINFEQNSFFETAFAKLSK